MLVAVWIVCQWFLHLLRRVQLPLVDLFPMLTWLIQQRNSCPEANLRSTLTSSLYIGIGNSKFISLSLKNCMYRMVTVANDEAARVWRYNSKISNYIAFSLFLLWPQLDLHFPPPPLQKIRQKSVSKDTHHKSGPKTNSHIWPKSRLFRLFLLHLFSVCLYFLFCWFIYLISCNFLQWLYADADRFDTQPSGTPFLT